MRKPNYSDAVQLVALNDGFGDTTALDSEEVAGMVSVGLMASLFDVPPLRFAIDVVEYRTEFLENNKE